MAEPSHRLTDLELPILTRRLRLEVPSLRRAAEYPPLIGDRDVSRWLMRVPFPYHLSDAREFIQRARKGRAEGSDLALAMVDRTTDRLVGGIGIHGISWEHEHGEVGYWLGRASWGLGYATEAVEAVVRLGFDRLGFHRFEACVFEGNSGSEHVLRKSGFRPEGTREEAFRKDGAWLDDLEFGLTKIQWQRAQARRTARRART